MTLPQGSRPATGYGRIAKYRRSRANLRNPVPAEHGAGPAYQAQIAPAGSVTFSAAGAGTVRLGPQIGQTWNLSVASLSVTPKPPVSEPQCSIFIGPAATQDNYIDGTYTGSQNSSTNVADVPVPYGWYVFAVWTGGDASAVGTLSCTGTMTVGVL